MKSYRCSKCGYKERKSVVPDSCNYCSERGSMKEIEDAAGLVEVA